MRPFAAPSLRSGLRLREHPVTYIPFAQVEKRSTKVSFMTMAIADTVPTNTAVQTILSQYESLLAEADRLFQDYIHTHSLKIACGAACSECCPCEVRVHFIEAYYLQMGMQALEPQVRHAIRLKALKNILMLERLKKIARAIEERSGGVIKDATGALSYLLQRKTKCPFVGEQGGCLVYRYRPLICGTFGIPLKIRKHHLWCDKNTPNPSGLPPLNVCGLEERVAELSRTLELLLTGQKHPRRFTWFAALFPLEKFIEGCNSPLHGDGSGRGII